jgi:hypothetical protein
MMNTLTAPLMLAALTISTSSAYAAINITEATIQNGSVFVAGNQAPKWAAISWEGTALSDISNNGGVFRFNTTNLPSDCVGRLTVGTETRDVVINNCTPRQGVVPTGQTLCYGPSYPETIPCPGTGQDGAFAVAQTQPRFNDLHNGAILDTLTGLVWLQNANCVGPVSWLDAIATANALADGACGLTDRSAVGDWRVPNRNELTSLLDLDQAGPALPLGHLFVNFQERSQAYWSSTVNAQHSGSAWTVEFYYGTVSNQHPRQEGGEGDFLAVR